MGTMNHNTVIATTWDNKEIERVRHWIATLNEKNRSLFLISKRGLNNYRTIVMTPDKSKEGWSESEEGNAIRALFITELKKGDYSDGSSSWQYVEIGYGEYGQKILQGNCKNCFSDSE